MRPGYDFRRGFGEAAIDGLNLFVNAAVPVSDKTEVYAFGGGNFRDTDAYAFTEITQPVETLFLFIPTDLLQELLLKSLIIQFLLV